jgi:Core-2/I-Branching enzyme
MRSVGSGPVVVAVLSHRDPPLVRRLVGRILEGDDTVVLLHHDPRGEPLGIQPSDRVLTVADARPCDWGRMSLALGMTRCLAAAVEQVPDFAWVLLVSGQDYPARHVRTIEADLATTSADAMLRHFRVDPEPGPDEHPWQVRCRQRYLHRIRIPGNRRSVPFPRRRVFGHGTDLYIGDMWVNLNARAVRHVLDQELRRPDLRRYFSHCSVPDEAYVPTLLLNDAPGLRVSAERHRYISWTPGHAHPRTLDVSDLEAIRASSADFFVRKVDPTTSAGLMAGLDAGAG